MLYILMVGILAGLIGWWLSKLTDDEKKKIRIKLIEEERKKMQDEGLLRK